MCTKVENHLRQLLGRLPHDPCESSKGDATKKTRKNSDADTAGTVGADLGSAEKAVLDAFNSTETDPSKKMEAIQKAQVNLDAARRIFTAFTEIMKGKHDIMMGVIRKLSLN